MWSSKPQMGTMCKAQFCCPRRDITGILLSGVKPYSQSLERNKIKLYLVHLVRSSRSRIGSPRSVVVSAIFVFVGLSHTWPAPPCCLCPVHYSWTPIPHNTLVTIHPKITIVLSNSTFQLPTFINSASGFNKFGSWCLTSSRNDKLPTQSRTPHCACSNHMTILPMLAGTEFQFVLNSLGLIQPRLSLKCFENSHYHLIYPWFHCKVRTKLLALGGTTGCVSALKVKCADQRS